MNSKSTKYKKKMKQLALAVALSLAGTAVFWSVSYAAQAEQEVVVTGYHFTGETLVPANELTAVLAKHIGQSATLKELEQQAGDITNYLRAKGYFVAFAYIPPQDFASGKIDIAIVPGHYGKVTINNKTIIKDKAVQRELGSVEPGEVINKSALERAIWLVGDMSGAEAKTTLKAGNAPGTTDLTVNVTPKGKRMWGYVGFDNGGYHYTGRYQYTGAFNYSNPFRDGDLLSITGAHSNARNGMWSGGISYITPIVGNGNKLGISYAKSHYLLGEDYTNSGYTGSADVLSLFFQHNFQRSRNANWYGQLRFDRKTLRDEIDSANSDNHKHTYNWVVGISGDTLDTWQGGGANTYSLTYTHGNLAIEDEVSKLFDDYGLGTGGSFGKYNLNITRLQQVRERLALYLSYARQWSSKNLDPSEKLCLGGPYGVRAYPVGEASGDEGWLGTAELRYNLPNKEGDKDVWQLITFVDGGSVRLSRNPLAVLADDNRRSLYGMGVGVNWSRESNWAARLHYAWKLGSEKALSDDDRSGRLWFQLYRFY